MTKNHEDHLRLSPEKNDSEERSISAKPSGVILPDLTEDPLIESIRRGSSYSKLSLGILGGAFLGWFTGLGFFLGMIIGGFIGFVAEQVGSNANLDDEKEER